MTFSLPSYAPPNFTVPPFTDAPTVVFENVKTAGVAPENYHATSIFPEYFHITKGQWKLAEESRMDCVVVLSTNGDLEVREFRRLQKGDRVACGRGEQGEDGIFVHTQPFAFPHPQQERFAFRKHLTRETSFSVDYDTLYSLLNFERENGFILWVSGPAAVFDRDAREAFVSLIEQGYVHGLLAGNALAVHDLEGSLYSTALGQEIYSKQTLHLGHYNHLDTINRIRQAGSIQGAIDSGLVKDGIMHSLLHNDVPYVLAGSIRDDGPLPEVIGDAYVAQDQMRAVARNATTVIALATQLHAIAAGNMTPSYRVLGPNRVRPVYFYTVDMSEFAVNKLANRGSLTAHSILTNVQDFVVILERGLRRSNT
jgi:lysine-ketoglutarate reductase/saccharopine dehydrogenase-like protein (TIGR00300 family)